MFQFYRELINFKRSGNPALMLKSINPKEVHAPTFSYYHDSVSSNSNCLCMQAHLLDKAAGAYVRFRLGGVSSDASAIPRSYVQYPVVHRSNFLQISITRSSLGARSWTFVPVVLGTTQPCQIVCNRLKTGTTRIQELPMPMVCRCIANKNHSTLEPRNLSTEVCGMCGRLHGQN